MKYGTIFGFSGINRNVSPFLTADGEFAESQNFITNKVGTLTKTGDYERKSPQVVAGYDILGGIDFQRPDGTHEHIVANDGASNAGIFKYTSPSWVNQSQTLTKGKKVSFAYSPTLDTLFAVNGTDSPRSYDGTSWSTTTNVTGAPKGKFVISFGRRIYILNTSIQPSLSSSVSPSPSISPSVSISPSLSPPNSVSSSVSPSSSTSPSQSVSPSVSPSISPSTGDYDFSSRAYRSSLVDSGSITWDTENDWFTFDDTLVGATRLGNNCLFLCNNSGHILTLNDEKYQVTNKGCVSADSICSYNEWAFWAGLDGFYGNDGSTTRKISLPIEEYWKGIPLANMSSIQAKVVGDVIVIYIGDITSPSTLSNVAFIYDINQNDWCRISFAHEFKNLHTYVTTTGSEMFAGNDNGEVFQLFTGGSQHGSTFTSFLETNWFYGSGPLNTDDFSEIWGFGEKLSGLKVYYKVDDKEWTPAGELNGSSDFVKLPKGTRGYRLKIRLQETSKDNLFEFSRIDVGYDMVYGRAVDTEL